VPSIHYYGNIWMQQLLVCDFIVGEFYESFDEMDRTTKLACLERVKQLHASNILHGDLRASNFVVQFEPEIKVFVIDFGRSKILDKDVETSEKKEFEESLVEEMNDFNSELNL
jgi:tRNA A-37 threonylcarbamoyl transferase component Bud32